MSAPEDEEVQITLLNFQFQTWIACFHCQSCGIDIKVAMAEELGGRTEGDRVCEWQRYIQEEIKCFLLIKIWRTKLKLDFVWPCYATFGLMDSWGTPRPIKSHHAQFLSALLIWNVKY